MNIIVCIKQVPVISAMQFDPETKTLKREGVPSEVSSFDARAVLAAVELRRTHGGEVTVITMGPPQARSALEDCLALGADKGLHLCDRAFAGADTLATAQALACALRQRPFDLILCGRNSTDAETGQVGPELAELLDIPQVTAARTLEVDASARSITAERETDAGFETVAAPLPLLVTAAEDLAPERFPSKADREAAKQKPIEEVTAAALSADASQFGAAGSPTWVVGLEAHEHQRQGRILAGDTPAAVVEQLVAELLAYGLYGTWRDDGEQPVRVPQQVARSGGKDVLVVAEVLNGTLRQVTLELLHKASELAASMGGGVAALLAGKGVRHFAETLAAHGAQRIFLADDAGLASVTTEPYAALLAQVIAESQPGVVLVPSSSVGRDVAPRVAARLRLGLTGDCIDLSLDQEGRLLQYKPAFGGSVVAPILSRTRPEIATVRPGMLPAGQADQTRRVEIVSVSANQTGSRVQVRSQRSQGGEAAELDEADVVVGVGIGVGGPEKLPVVTALADVLGASLCATRDVTDKGWLPRQYQVGLTGRVIAPKLYIGIGVRGAFEHIVGIRRAGLIVAINIKPKAPVFKSADLGVVGDYNDYVPLLTEHLRRVCPVK